MAEEDLEEKTGKSLFKMETLYLFSNITNRVLNEDRVII